MFIYLKINFHTDIGAAAAAEEALDLKCPDCGYKKLNFDQVRACVQKHADFERRKELKEAERRRKKVAKRAYNKKIRLWEKKKNDALKKEKKFMMSAKKIRQKRERAEERKILFLKRKGYHHPIQPERATLYLVRSSSEFDQKCYEGVPTKIELPTRTCVVVLGRSIQKSDIVLDAPFYMKGLVSRTHVRLHLRRHLISGRLMIKAEDMESTNGTFINGQEIYPHDALPSEASEEEPDSFFSEEEEEEMENNAAGVVGENDRKKTKEEEKKENIISMEGDEGEGEDREEGNDEEEEGEEGEEGEDEEDEEEEEEEMDPESRKIQIADFKELLMRCPIIYNLGVVIVEKLSQLVNIELFLNDEYLIKEDDIGDDMFVVVSGTIAILKRRVNDTPLELARLGRGAAVGELALQGNGHRSASIISIGGVFALRITREQIKLLEEEEKKEEKEKEEEEERREREGTRKEEEEKEENQNVEQFQQQKRQEGGDAALEKQDTNRSRSDSKVSSSSFARSRMLPQKTTRSMQDNNNNDDDDDDDDYRVITMNVHRVDDDSHGKGGIDFGDQPPVFKMRYELKHGDVLTLGCDLNRPTSLSQVINIRFFCPMFFNPVDCHVL